MTHSVSTDDLTIYVTDDRGETYDLNAEGEPCRSKADLHDFIDELHNQGFFAETTCRDLHDHV